MIFKDLTLNAELLRETTTSAANANLASVTTMAIMNRIIVGVNPDLMFTHRVKVNTQNKTITSNHNTVLNRWLMLSISTENSNTEIIVKVVMFILQKTRLC